MKVYRILIILSRTELGSAAADLYWRRLLNNLESQQFVTMGMRGTDIAPILLPDDFVRRLTAAIRNWTFALPSISKSTHGSNVSNKVSRLCEILDCFSEEGDLFRGLIIGQ